MSLKLTSLSTLIINNVYPRLRYKIVLTNFSYYFGFLTFSFLFIIFIKSAIIKNCINLKIKIKNIIIINITALITSRCLIKSF
jgi:hypothetical protein